MKGIDRNRGCTIRFHPSGFRVVMYKDAPGEYLDEQGGTIAEKIAQQAGYDTAALGKERKKRQRLAEYRAKVEEEFSTEQEDTEALLSQPEDGLVVKHVGKGKYAILGGDGQRLTKNPLSKAEAQTLIDDLKAGGQDHGS